MGATRSLFFILAFALPEISSGLIAQQPGDRLRGGAALMRAERPAEAETVLKTIGERDADYAAAQTLLGYIHMRRSALDQAEQAFRKVLTIDSGSAPARFGLGMTLSRKGLLQDAASQFENLFEDASFGGRSRSQWIQTLFWMGKEEEAYAEARRLSTQFPSIAEYHGLLGFLSQVKGDADAARRAFGRAVELDPTRLTDYYGLISICRMQKDWQGAIHWTFKALALDPHQPLLYEELAGIYARLGMSREAEQAAEEALRTRAAEMLYAKAAKARVEGRTGESEKLLRECLQANPRLSKAWIDLGEIARRQNHPEEALKNFRRALEIDPSNPMARLGAAAVLQERAEKSESQTPAVAGGAAGNAMPAEPEDGRDALSILLRAVRDYPDNPDLLAGLGRVQESRENPVAALESYSAALRIDPLDVGAILGKARQLLKSGEVRQAISEFRRAAELEPSNLQTWRGLVQAYRQAKDSRGAEAACRQCLERNPGDSDCLELLAYLNLEGADYHAAASLFDTILRNGRASKDLLDSLGFAYLRLGERQEAVDMLESSLKRYGPDPWIYSNLGYLYQGMGKIQAAIANYRRARDLSPRDPEINHNLGFALYLAKDYASALKPFKVAVRIRPDWGLAHFNLAMTYWNLRQYPMALTHARIAEEHGSPGASRVVQTLSASLSLGMPRVVTVYGPKK